MNAILNMFLITSMALAGGGEGEVSQAPEFSIPETITVRVTGESECYEGITYHIEEMDFMEYVKGVLPAEWGNNWHEESLRAGAIAVKMYAWDLIDAGGKYNDADVYDCHWDQVYRPEWRTEATDKAVEDTWHLALVTDNPGELVRTYYNAWYGGCIIRELPGQCMGQWNSLKRAEQGMMHDEILSIYYEHSELVAVEDVPSYRADILERRAKEQIEQKEVEDSSDVAYYYTIEAGDTLSKISDKFYGSVSEDYWMPIYEANKDVLRSPDLINVGVTIAIPSL